MFDYFSDEQYEQPDNGNLIDVFAAYALVGIVSRGETTNQYEMARDAYKIARAMLEERKKANDSN